MPEIAELRLSADYVNERVRNRTFVKCETASYSKQPDLSAEVPSAFTMYAIPRGKELQLVIQYAGTTTIKCKITFTFGMSGYFAYIAPNVEVRHAVLMFTADDGRRLCFVDPRRFGTWKIRDFNANRGPDMLEDFDGFLQRVKAALDEQKQHKAKTYLSSTAVCELLLDQGLFNGVGNYLRAEILHRLDINPFLPITVLSTQQIAELLVMCASCAEDAYRLGGGQLMSWKNPYDKSAADFKSWVKVYGKGFQTVGPTKRTFWYDAKWREFDPWRTPKQDLTILMKHFILDDISSAA